MKVCHHLYEPQVRACDSKGIKQCYREAIISSLFSTTALHTHTHIMPQIPHCTP